jgi:hypothetical protein
MLANLWSSFRRRIKPFYNPTAWAMILISTGGVSLFDPVMAKTVLEWMLMFGVFAGVAVIISLHVFPEIDLTAHVKNAFGSPTGSGLVVLGVCTFLSFLVLALTLWGKA